MAGKITNDGRIHVGELIDTGLGNIAGPSKTYGYLEIGTGTTPATVTDAGIETALALGGRVALSGGYPKVTINGTSVVIEVVATYAAGSFTTGVAITEAAWVDSAGTICAGRGILDVPKNPTSSEPLTITATFTLVAN